MTDADGAVLDERNRDRRPHARGCRVLRGPLVDTAVRLLDETDEPLLAAAVDLGAEGSRRQSRRDLSRPRPAHAVGDREQGRVADPGVLVAATLAAGMGQARAPASGAHAS